MPVVIERRRMTLINEGLLTMPYHHESIGMREEEANALIARVQRSIAECTSRALREVIADLTPAEPFVALTICEPPFAELPETVATVRQLLDSISVTEWDLASDAERAWKYSDAAAFEDTAKEARRVTERWTTNGKRANAMKLTTTPRCTRRWIRACAI
jgi:hypothetical protein